MTTPGVSDFSPEALLERLDGAAVEYVVIGGLAAVLHGASHVTGDLDICYSREPANLRKLADAVAPLNPRPRGAPADPSFQMDAATLRAGLNFTLTTDAGDIDLIGEVSGLGGYDRVVERSETVDVAGTLVRVLSLDGLIAAKRATGRAKDRILLNELEILRRLRDEE